uniref:Putative LOC100745168 [Bombus impatiens] n=1 Tax=Lepeophtheirus salmonis TaxID=72036 RepID=A0A0K2T2X4_LEPSM
MPFSGSGNGDGMDLPSKFIISHKGPIGTTSQQSTAAAFFARNHSKTSSPVHNLLQVAGKSIMRPTDTDFTSLLEANPPPTPSYLLKRLELSNASSHIGETSSSYSPGKVKVLLRISHSLLLESQKTGMSFQLDRKKKQVTLIDPTFSSLSGPNLRAAPKMFAFDGVFTDSDSQIELAGSALTDTIHSVLTGIDGCVFSFGHAKLGKTRTMIGCDDSAKNLGIIPTAIAWLFRCIKDNKHCKFSVRVTACEILQKNGEEEMRDLLNSSGEGATDPFGSPAASSILQRQTEVKCSNVEKAGQYLDIALNNRLASDSHFVYVLSIYRTESSHAESNLPVSTRSRLYLVDFGCCDRGTNGSRGGITQSGLGNVILSIFNRARHLPSKESKVTQMIKECLSSTHAKATMIAHVTPEATHYSETLHTVQLASRIHRMRRSKRNFKGSGSSGGGGSGSGSSDDTAMKNKILIKSHATSSSDFTDPSSSEQSCDTVIYVGPRDDEGTDAEHPPVFIPNLNSGDNRGIMSKALRGLDIPLHLNHSLERRKKPSTTHSTPLNGIKGRPGSVGSTPVRSNTYNIGRGSLPRNPKGKMPLYGKVAGYRQTPKGDRREHEVWVDSKPPLYVNKLTTEQQFAVYGYMDEFKRGMINQWVNEQSQVPSPKIRSKEPEPFAWLKETEDLNEVSNDGCKVLTTFKTAESSDESFSEGKERNECDTHNLLIVDVHNQPALRNSFASSSSGSNKSNACTNTEPHPHASTVEMPRDFEPEEILRISDNVAELVFENTIPAPKMEDASVQVLEKDVSHREEEKNNMEEISSSSSSCPPPIELKSESLHYIASKKISSSYSVNEEDFAVLEKENGFETKIDQLAKLHELYQSVSSINAKSQNRLRNVSSEMGSCFSLGAHQNGDDEGGSLKSDLNSLCSEPVIQRIEESSLDIEEAMNDLCKFTVSLSDLKKGLFFSRSDSPVLEGMDRELAKYAKLKDLDTSYEASSPSPPQASLVSLSCNDNKTAAYDGNKESIEVKKKNLEKQLEDQILQLEQLRHPDGASNPDLNNVPVARRSPGNGRSDPEIEEDISLPVPRDKTTLSSLDRQVLGKSSSSSSGSFTGRSKDDIEKSETCNPPLPSSIPKEEVPCKSTPKFSRLFSGNKKSRSKEKKSSSSTPKKNSIVASTPREDSSKKSSSSTPHRKLKFFSRSSHKAKNAISTPSQHYSPRSKKNSKGVNAKPLSSTYIPSPYSFPSAPLKKTTGSSSTSSGRGSTTGYESGGEFLHQRSHRVKLRGRGAHSNHCKSSGYESVSERDSVEEDIKIIVSECNRRPEEEFKEGSEEKDEPVTLTRIYPESIKLPPVDVLKYEDKQVDRLDRRWRFWEFSRLKDRQKNLKVAMRDAKSRISRSSSVRWSYELHVEENGGVKRDDPAFIDAFRKETDILQKRVEACKAHATLMTCFDAIPSDPMSPYLKKQWENCCTTDCDPMGSLSRPLDPRESEIF